MLLCELISTHTRYSAGLGARFEKSSESATLFIFALTTLKLLLHVTLPLDLDPHPVLFTGVACGGRVRQSWRGGFAGIPCSDGGCFPAPEPADSAVPVNRQCNAGCCAAAAACVAGAWHMVRHSHVLG